MIVIHSGTFQNIGEVSWYWYNVSFRDIEYLKPRILVLIKLREWLKVWEKKTNFWPHIRYTFVPKSHKTAFRMPCSSKFTSNDCSMAALHQKVSVTNMIKTGVYSAENMNFYMYSKYIWEKLSKSSNFAQIMLFVRL